jgi:hypothetical protein
MIEKKSSIKMANGDKGISEMIDRKKVFREKDVC